MCGMEPVWSWTGTHTVSAWSHTPRRGPSLSPGAGIRLKGLRLALLTVLHNTIGPTLPCVPNAACRAPVIWPMGLPTGPEMWYHSIPAKYLDLWEVPGAGYPGTKGHMLSTRGLGNPKSFVDNLQTKDEKLFALNYSPLLY